MERYLVNTEKFYSKKKQLTCKHTNKVMYEIYINHSCIQREISITTLKYYVYKKSAKKHRNRQNKFNF